MNHWRFTALRKAFGAQALFEITELSIAIAHAHVLTGANGAGKSTLLRMLAGLETAPGAVAACASSRWAMSPYPHALRDRIAYVHQQPYVFATSVRANLAYGLRARGMRKTEAIVEDAIDWAGVRAVLDVPPHRLSGGEKQRIALARARALDPALLLLDEPTNNLDGEAREKVLALIDELRREGRTVLVVCHDRDIINLPGVSHLKLKNGRIERR